MPFTEVGTGRGRLWGQLKSRAGDVVMAVFGNYKQLCDVALIKKHVKYDPPKSFLNVHEENREC